MERLVRGFRRFLGCGLLAEIGGAVCGASRGQRPHPDTYVGVKEVPDR